MIERSQVWVPAGASGELCSPGLTFCADSILVSVPPRCYHNSTKRFWSFCHKCRWQVLAKYTCILPIKIYFMASNKVWFCGHHTNWMIQPCISLQNWCMVVWCPQNFHRNGSTSHVTTKQCCNHFGCFYVQNVLCKATITYSVSASYMTRK